MKDETRINLIYPTFVYLLILLPGEERDQSQEDDDMAK